jgi:HPt (histidine-containing phosphotransfer) domain-containing protein
MSEQKLYNLDMVKTISNGNNDFVKKMINIFMDTTPPEIAIIKNCLGNGDYNLMGATAHKIKPSIDTMGIQDLMQDIRAIEKYGKEASNLDELPALVEKLENTLSTVFEQLKEELNTL